MTFAKSSAKQTKGGHKNFTVIGVNLSVGSCVTKIQSCVAKIAFIIKCPHRCARCVLCKYLHWERRRLLACISSQQDIRVWSLETFILLCKFANVLTRIEDACNRTQGQVRLRYIYLD